MSRPDATASAALSAQIIKPIFFGFLDFVNEPIRANTSGADVTVTGSGMVDLDGAYIGINGDFVEVGEIKHSEGGNDSVDITLSALIDLDADMLNEIGNTANWQGRTVRLWRVIRNADNVQQGGFQHYYTGYMTGLDVNAAPQNQVMTITVEGYLAAHSPASNRTMLDQELYDPGDLSARATIGIGNGISGNPMISNTGLGSGAYGGGSDNLDGMRMLA
jgi:hypothetical protein